MLEAHVVIPNAWGTIRFFPKVGESARSETYRLWRCRLDHVYGVEAWCF